jgi:thymidylate kinase
MRTSPSRPFSIELHPLVRLAFAALDEQGVHWALLRDGDLHRPEGDVDVLVARDDFQRAHEALAGLGFVRLRVWGHGSHAFFLGYHVETDAWIWLDVVTDVRFGRYQSLRVAVEGELLARRERPNGVPILSADDAYWMLLLHSLLDKESVPVRHRARLQELARSATGNGSLARFFEVAAPSEWTVVRLTESIGAGDWEVLDTLGQVLRRRLVSHSGGAALSALANRNLRALSRWIPRSPGMMVALLGPDGAGKSTLAASLRRSFPTYDVRVVYMGLYQGEAARFVHRVPALYVTTRLALAWARYIKARTHRAAGRLVVLDRYVYDTFLSPRHPLPRLRRAHAWVVARSLPGPDLVLVLDVPGQTAFARKGEDEPASLEHQRRGYLELSRRLRHVHVIDASSGADAVRRQAVSVIWTARAHPR